MENWSRLFQRGEISRMGWAATRLWIGSPRWLRYHFQWQTTFTDCVYLADGLVLAAVCPPSFGGGIRQPCASYRSVSRKSTLSTRMSSNGHEELNGDMAALTQRNSVGFGPPLFFSGPWSARPLNSQGTCACKGWDPSIRPKKVFIVISTSNTANPALF